MTQNTSSAVMQRRVEPHDSLDDFPTPPWATRALCEWIALGGRPRSLTVREPAANRGYMVRPLREYFADVEAADVFDYGAGFPVRDYLFGPLPPMVDWTITNPPFRLAEQFVARALETSARGVAMLTRVAFLEGIGRYHSLFSVTPPTDILQFTERVPMFRGRCEPGSTATAYCWLVWKFPLCPTEFRWIAPCRTLLERAGDYDLPQVAA